MLARIHIASNMDLMDEDVYVEIDIPYPLQVGDVINLKEETTRQLEKKATANLKIAKKFFPEWFCDTEAKRVEDADLNDLDFSGATTIRFISYTEGEPFVDIELCDYEDYESTKYKVENLLRELLQLQNKTALN